MASGAGLVHRSDCGYDNVSSWLPHHEVPIIDALNQPGWQPGGNAHRSPWRQIGLAWPMGYGVTLRGERFDFDDLASLLACANEEKSGDQLAGLAAGSRRERVAARLVLADLPVRELVDRPLVDDDVTGLILDGLDQAAFAHLASATVGELREMILDREFPDRWAGGLAGGITPEMAAAVAKLMSDK